MKCGESKMKTENIEGQSMKLSDQLEPVTSKTTPETPQPSVEERVKQPIDYEPTAEMKLALEQIKSSAKTLLILGKAGTGKSTFIKHLAGQYQSGLVLVAPTGIAAINIEGQTIHSFFKLNPHYLFKDGVERDWQPEIYQKIDYLVIDEISMVRADLIDAVDYALRINRNNQAVPFGGVKVILIGDLSQLPPVSEHWDWEKFDRSGKYKTEFFFSSNIIKELIQNDQIEILEFTQPLRQTDPAFLEILSHVRDGNLTDKVNEALDDRIRAHQSIKGIPNLTILTSTNAAANRYNSSELEQLPSELFEYIASIKGDFIKVAEKDLPNFEKIQLKDGAQVVFIKNDPGGAWVNGTIGIVKKSYQDFIVVESNGKSLTVHFESWNKYKYQLEDGKLVKTVCGEFQQLPVKLGWALTIHRSQGLTLDNVFVDTGNGAFAAGQVYVALSRVRRIDNLFLKQAIRERDLIQSRAIRSFLKVMGR